MGVMAARKRRLTELEAEVRRLRALVERQKRQIAELSGSKKTPAPGA